MKIGDKVWIQHIDIDGICYGDSVCNSGTIVGNKSNGKWPVEYTEKTFYRKVTGYFFEHELLNRESTLL